MMKLMTGTALALCATAALAQDPGDELVVNGEIEMTVRAPAAEHMEYIDTVRSGWTFRSPETRELQMDDFDNPGMLAVEAGLETWNTPEGTEGKSCADCHGAPEESMTTVRATYPKWNEDAGEVRTISKQINACRTENMGAEAYKLKSAGMQNMEAVIASVGRGEIINVAIDGPAAEMWEKGKEIYYTRYGQLELSCANCHEDNYDNLIRADHLSQGQLNGFPVYRLKQARLLGPHERFVGCIRDTRAEPFAMGSEEFDALELYVASRGNGLSVEGPSVRN
ncbi:MAG: sulfur oxidation c-type cytochrome SoxA [Rhodobacterales bacterium]|nr:MAG: sulfur oxidation c-type cytochrome SoxA [Rhodobacterales bacterium]